MKKIDKESLAEKAKKLDKIGPWIDFIVTLSKDIRFRFFIVGFICGFGLAAILVRIYLERLPIPPNVHQSKTLELSERQVKFIEDFNFTLKLDVLSVSINASSASINAVGITVNNEKSHTFTNVGGQKNFAIRGNEYMIYFVEANEKTAKFVIEEFK